MARHRFMKPLETWIDRYRRRLQFGRFLGRAAEWLAGTLLLLGAAVLIVKLLAPALWPDILWSAVLLAPALFVAWRLAVREGFSRGEAAALLDRRLQAGGLVMSLAEASDGRWSARFPIEVRRIGRALPRVRPSRFARLLALPTLFAAAVCLIPPRSARTEPPRQGGVRRQATAELKQLLEHLDEAQAVSPEERQRLRREVEKLAEESGEAPLTREQWETLDAVRARLRHRLEEASRTVQKARRAAAALQQAETGSSAEGERAARHAQQVALAERELADALRQLAQLSKSDVRSQKSEVRGQKSGVRGQESEVRDRETGGRRQESGDTGLKAGGRGQEAGVQQKPKPTTGRRNPEVGGQKSEIGGQEPELRSGDGRESRIEQRASGSQSGQAGATNSSSQPSLRQSREVTDEDVRRWLDELRQGQAGQLPEDPRERRQMLERLQAHLQSQGRQLGRAQATIQEGRQRDSSSTPQSPRSSPGGPFEGGGRAALTFNEVEGEAGVRFRDVILPTNRSAPNARSGHRPTTLGAVPGGRDAELPGEPVGESARAPKAEPSGEAARAPRREFDPALGRETWKRPLRPRHRSVVRRYFDEGGP